MKPDGGFVRAAPPRAEATVSAVLPEDAEAVLHAQKREKALRAYQSQARLFAATPATISADPESSLKELTLEDLLDSERKAA